MRFRFQLAGPEHEAKLRLLLAEEAMPGSIRLAYTREPDFFAGLRLEGAFSQAFIALEGEAIVAMGTRAIRARMVNGQPEDVGYLGGLRAQARVRGRLGLSRGYGLLREIHQDGRCKGYLSTILEANRKAMALLTSDRAGMPIYRDLGRLWSHLILVERRRDTFQQGVRRAKAEDLARVSAFLFEHGQARQFFPVFDPKELDTPSLQGLRIEDFWLLEREGKLLAVLGVWDQRARRQLRVVSYAPWLKLARPLLNGGLRLRGFAPLPPEGAEVPMVAGAFLRVASDDPADLKTLLKGVLAGLRDAGLLGLALVFHDRDPLRAAMESFATIPLASRLYGVGWEDADPWFGALESTRVPYMDAAFL
jgi:hypothetical protein